MTLSLLNIPVEVLEKILSEDCLSYVDIIRLATVCKTIYTVTVSNFVWSRKFRQRLRFLKSKTTAVIYTCFPIFIMRCDFVINHFDYFCLIFLSFLIAYILYSDIIVTIIHHISAQVTYVL